MRYSIILYAKKFTNRCTIEDTIMNNTNKSPHHYIR